MKHIAQSLGLGLAILAATSASPRAADWAVGSGGVIKDFGSVKDYRNAAVPVPAPTPAPSYTGKDWYVRGDIGWTLASNTDISATGGITTRDDLDGFAFGSIGAGRYLTPSIRAEMSFDFRPKKSVTGGSYSFKGDRTVTTAINATTTQVDTYHLTLNQTENSAVADQTGFFSLYYDLNQGGRLKPYIGAGLGLDSRRYKRTTSQTNACNTFDSVVTDTATATTTTTNGIDCTGGSFSSQASNGYTSTLGVAVAFMAGVGYEVAPGITWDTGYRAVWQGAEVTLGAPSAADHPTVITISDRLDHELRTGVRIDLQ